ncbi:hypothetical protein GOV06_05405 [Candidatus Woesearchaeota archaeon]|nr:hypothetical protein [Candidatus Woesearchaeota archaeon]
MKERDWLLLESRYIQKLKYAIKIKDLNLIRRFEKKAARAESRINQFEKRILKITDFLRKIFPSWNQALFETEEKLKLYNKNILKRVSYVDGTIIKLLKERETNYDKINSEVDAVMKEGISPMLVLLGHLEKEFKRISAEEVIVEERKEGEEVLETSLNKQPFLILFHSANQKTYVNSILAARHALPEYYMGRKLEYAFEADYFWIEHHGKISGFLGHAPHGMIPGRAKKILNMRRGETSAENILKRKGLLIPKWLFARIGKIKLAVEVKSGWGSDTNALDELVKMVKSYHLENNIIFYCFSVWVLSYLKAKLPNALTIVICWRGPGGSVIQFPFNRPFESIKKWGFFVSAGNLGFVDVLSSPAKKSEKKIIKQISKSTSANKYHFAGRVKSREQFDWLLKHGARGGMLWVDADKLINWIIQGEALRKNEERSVA